jgi:vacuolar protein sorting-associated protein 29
MSQFGELVLLIGDLHIPQRSVDLPEKFKELLVPGKVQHILCTGNIGNREHTDWLKGLASNVHIVRGDFDEGVSLPEQKVVTIGEWKIGIIHGHQVIPWGDKEALSNTQRMMDCELLVSGHTHASSTESLDGKYFINPGSATGAYSSLTSDVRPSFIIIALQGREATSFLYELVDDSVSVTKGLLVKSS